MILKMMKVLPTTVLGIIFYGGALLGLIFRFLTNSVIGVGVLSAIVYAYQLACGDTKPYSLSELVLFWDSLSDDMKSSTLSSLVTVLGFLIVFRTTTLSWRGEWLARYKADIAKEIESFCKEVQEMSIDMGVSLKAVVQAVQKYQNEGATPSAIFYIKNAMEEAQKYDDYRRKFSKKVVEIHRFRSQYNSIFNSISDADDFWDEVLQGVQIIGEKMWIILPYVDSISDKNIEPFISQINVEEYENLAKEIDSAQIRINGGSGALQGKLLGKLLIFNFLSYLKLLQNRNILQMYVNHIKKVK